MTTTVDQVHQALLRLEAAQARLQAHYRTETIIQALGAAAQAWLVPDSPWRAQAIAQAPQLSGFSPEMVAEAIELTFGTITPETLTELLRRELGEPQLLDQFCARGPVQTRVHGPRLITHFLAGNVPVPGIVSICCGLLLKSANLVKAARRDPVFPALFVESLRAVDAGLADAVAVLGWSRTETAVTAAALEKAGAVIAYGDDNSVAALRKLAPPGVPFLGYGHKLSFGYVAKEAMTEANLAALTQAAAFDVSVYDQHGCLSPHVIYVEERGELGPRRFAAALATAMGQYQLRVPRGTLSPAEAAAIMQLRHSYEFRAAADRRVAVWASPRPNDWTVIYEDDLSFTPSCLNRVVFVKPAPDPARVLAAVSRYAEQISCAGLAPLGAPTALLAEGLAGLGIHRLCALGQMQRPPLARPHDGRPNLAALVRWTDWG